MYKLSRIEITSNCRKRKLSCFSSPKDMFEFRKQLVKNDGLSKVGEGTYGSVYKTRTPTGNLVAVKRIYLENEKNGFPITALREIKLLKFCDHPNIVSLLDVVSVKRKKKAVEVFMIFEYLDHDLSGLMANREFKLQEAHIKFYMRNIFSGLQYMHADCKLVHRDIKGANIMIGKNGVARIGDFGLARQFSADESKEYTGRVVTLWYRAPELLLGLKNYGPAVDMWSVGCILSEMIFGKPTFPGETEMQQLTLICKLVGSPSKENFERFDKISVKLKSFYPRVLDQRYQKLKTKSPMAFDLLDKLLVLDPKKRITASEALAHGYFSESPTEECAKLSSLLSSHDYESRLRRRKRDGLK